MAGLFSSGDLVELSDILERELELKLHGEDLDMAATAIIRFTCAKMLRQKNSRKEALGWAQCQRDCHN